MRRGAAVPDLTHQAVYDKGRVHGHVVLVTSPTIPPTTTFVSVLSCKSVWNTMEYLELSRII